MKTKEQAKEAALWFVKRGEPTYIYRVGPAWMFTSASLDAVQAKYKVPVREYEEVKGRGSRCD